MVQSMRPNFGQLQTVSQLTFVGLCWPFPVFHMDYLIAAHIHARVSRSSLQGPGEAIQPPATLSWDGGGGGRMTAWQGRDRLPALAPVVLPKASCPSSRQPASGPALSTSLELLSQDLQGFSPEQE